MYGIVYITQNLINGKKYIGQHKCERDNDTYLGSGTKLVEDIKKYGRENFKRIILYYGNSPEELDEMEIQFIKYFDAVEREDYYNIAKGGLVMAGEFNPMYGRTYTEEEKRLIGEKQRGEKHWNWGRHWSEEAKEKMRHPHKGNSGWAANVKRTPEHCKHISESKKGKKATYTKEQREQMASRVRQRNQTENFKQQVSEANRRFHENGGRRGGKAVICIETGIVYKSGYDAERALGIRKGSISSCLAGSCKTLKGYHWRFATAEESVMAVTS